MKSANGYFDPLEPFIRWQRFSSEVTHVYLVGIVSFRSL